MYSSYNKPVSMKQKSFFLFNFIAKSRKIFDTYKKLTIQTNAAANAFQLTNAGSKVISAWRDELCNIVYRSVCYSENIISTSSKQLK